MEFLRKHGALIVAGFFIAFGSYNLGLSAGDESTSTRADGIENQNEGRPGSVDFSAFWRTWNLIEEKYVPASTTVARVSDEQKVYGAIQGLANSLNDPYTVFFPPVESEMFEADIRGNFEGVGMEVLSQDGSVTVIAPLKNSPAERAGMLAGDRIVRVDGEPTAGLSTEEAVTLIRGPKGTSVTFTVFRDNIPEPFEISVVREVINLPTVDVEILPGNIFKIELYNFSEQSPNLFRQALRSFILAKTDKLILDLRGNPGGYLEAAIDMASWFLPSSKMVVRENFGGRQEEKVYRSRGYDIFTDDLRFVILVDRGSASASEILAGALQEHGRAVIVGEKTFGKGSVQELVDITPETSLKITIARWLTPKGQTISDKGITPDYPVEMSAEDRSKGLDPQLDKAIEILSGSSARR